MERMKHTQTMRGAGRILGLLVWCCLGAAVAKPMTYQKMVDVAGKSLQLTLTVEDVGDLEKEVEHISGLYFEHWPKIVRMIDAPVDKTPRHLSLKFRQQMGHPAHVSGQEMVLEVKHLRQHPEDTSGVFVHELTHFVQNYTQPAPGWFVEGVADYVRYKTFPESLWAKRGKKQTDRSKAFAGYWNSTAFLLWLEKHHRPGLVALVSRRCKEGKYKETVWEELTGKDLKQLAALYRK